MQPVMNFFLKLPRLKKIRLKFQSFAELSVRVAPNWQTFSPSFDENFWNIPRKNQKFSALIKLQETELHPKKNFFNFPKFHSNLSLIFSLRFEDTFCTKPPRLRPNCSIMLLNTIFSNRFGRNSAWQITKLFLFLTAKQKSQSKLRKQLLWALKDTKQTWKDFYERTSREKGKRTVRDAERPARLLFLRFRLEIYF